MLLRNEQRSREGSVQKDRKGASPTSGITEEPGSAVRGARVCILSVVDCVCLVLLNELHFPHMTHETRSLLEDERIERESTGEPIHTQQNIFPLQGILASNTGAGPVCGSSCFRMMDSVVHTDAL